MIKLVCFDLDHTLINEVHSVMLLCLLNGREKEHAIVQEQEELGIIDYKTADYQRAKLVEGLDSSLVYDGFIGLTKPLDKIADTIRTLHSRNIQSIIITVGPKQVADAARDLWGANASYGSIYETSNGHFTGKITSYIDGYGKVDCLNDYCLENNITPEECIAVGDGSTDIPLFKHCHRSIAINASPSAIQSASCSIITSDLSGILPYIL